MLYFNTNQDLKLLRTVLFWAITQHVVVIPYHCFGTTCQSHH